MAFSKVQANWAAVQFGTEPISKVTQVSFSQGGQLQEFAADTDAYPTLLVNLMSKPTASVASADAGRLMAIPPGSVATFTATHKDARGLANGDIQYTMSNAVAENVDTSGGFNAFGTATFRMRAYSSDGITNPLSFTQVRT